MKLIAKKIIYGCDSHGDGQSPYLTRWTLFSCRFGAAYVHKFHRSDSPEHHDHPWAFASLILWRGYFEETICRSCEGNRTTGSGQGWRLCRACNRTGRHWKRAWPGALLLRRATHRHRVILIDSKPAWTLVIRGPYVREWCFFTKAGWQKWKDYFREKGC